MRLREAPNLLVNEIALPLPFRRKISSPFQATVQEDPALIFHSPAAYLFKVYLKFRQDSRSK